jgi:hypothetical protein
MDERAGTAAQARWAPELFNDRADALPDIDASASNESKVRLFLRLFVGRDDVWALRWENDRTRKAGWGPAVRGGWANSRRAGS